MHAGEPPNTSGIMGTRVDRRCRKDWHFLADVPIIGRCLALISGREPSSQQMQMPIPQPSLVRAPRTPKRAAKDGSRSSSVRARTRRLASGAAPCGWIGRVKSEGRKKTERRPNRARPRVSVFGFRISTLGLRASGFGLQSLRPLPVIHATSPCCCRPSRAGCGRPTSLVPPVGASPTQHAYRQTRSSGRYDAVQPRESSKAFPKPGRRCWG